jgi:hypothetical protein
MDRHRNAGAEIPQPGSLLGKHEEAYVNAILEGIAVSGGELLLPSMPALPDWVDEDMRAVASLFGWLRVAVADTSGEMLHSPGVPLYFGQVDRVHHLPALRPVPEGFPCPGFSVPGGSSCSAGTCADKSGTATRTGPSAPRQ